MRRRSGFALLAWALLLFATAAWAIERFPPPDFESGHQQPKASIPPSRSLPLEYLDVGVLLVALGLATFLVYRSRSRRGVFWLSLASLAYFGFYREGCVCAIGSIQNVALALVDNGYRVPLPVVAFFSLPLLFALFFGRTFCSSVCPHGALQDLVLLRPIAVPRWIENPLSMLAYLYLGAGILFATCGGSFIICKYDPYVAFFRRTGGADLLVLGGALLAIGLFVGRPYCRYLCPYGVLLGLASRLSWRRVTIYPDECVKCRLCEDSCPYGAIRQAAPEPVSFDRRLERRRLTTFLVLAPLLVAYFAWLGSKLGAPLSKSNPTVRLAERVWQEDAGKVKGTTDASENFRNTGKSSQELLKNATAVGRRFARGGWFLGAWIGLVLGVKLIAGTVWRSRTEYEADRGACVACARCFPYCPEMSVRLKALEDLPK